MTHQPADGERDDGSEVELQFSRPQVTRVNLHEQCEAALAAAAEQLRQKDEELKRAGERLAAAERLVNSVYRSVIFCLPGFNISRSDAGEAWRLYVATQRDGQKYVSKFDNAIDACLAGDAATGSSS